MGGRGLGHWEGVPMALLVRMALEEADDLDRAIAIFRDHPRTCEYYYVIADGKSGKAVGMEASWVALGVVGMGESHPRLPHAVKDAVLLSVGSRYEELVRRVRDGYGTFDAESARRLMDRPVAMKSNLHSVLFETGTTRLWVANASKEGAPAATQPYHEFTFAELLAHRPDPEAPALPPPPAPPSDAAASRCSSDRPRPIMALVGVGRSSHDRPALPSARAGRSYARQRRARHRRAWEPGEMLMRMLRTAAPVVAAWGLVGGTVAGATEIQLRTAEGFQGRPGRVELRRRQDHRGDRQGTRRQCRQDRQPRAQGPRPQPRRQQVEGHRPKTLKNPRSTGQVCLCWYRIHVTIPDSARSSLEGILTESGPRISTRPKRAIPRRALEGLDRKCR